MNNPLVSIVLPYRNAASTIDTCLRSVFAQSFTDFELLAINDHSTDDSRLRVSVYRQQDKRLRCLNAPHRGLVATLNYGLHEARGPFIARMDADDLMRPNRLQQQVQALRQHSDWALVASQVKLFPEHTIQAGYREYIRWQNQCLTADDIAADIYRESPFAHPSVMFRKADILQLGAYREGDFAEDYDLWLRMYQAGLRMAKLPQILLDWRDSPDRLSRVDPRCTQQAFDRLRAHYLAQDPRLQSRFVIWGAGRKTRLRCRPLQEQGLNPVAWIDIDPAKIGNTLQGVPVVAPDWLLHQQPAPLVLIYVRNHGAHRKIAEFLESAAYRHGHDFLFIG